MRYLDTEIVMNHWAQVPGFRHLTTAALALPQTQGEGRPQRFNQAKAGMGKYALWALCSGKRDYTEKSLMPQNPTGRVLIQLQPFTLLTQDFYGRNSLKLLKKKSHELLQSQRDAPVLYRVKSHLPVTSLSF